MSRLSGVYTIGIETLIECKFHRNGTESAASRVSMFGRGCFLTAQGLVGIPATSSFREVKSMSKIPVE
ncbi:hypothetical protein ACHAXS_000985 [Conticribra weissflogii]